MIDKLKRTEILRRLILVHSYIYYELDQNVISDAQYDALSKELVSLQNDIDNRQGMYYDVFKEFDGNTGFDLFHLLSWQQKEIIVSIARNILMKNWTKGVNK